VTIVELLAGTDRGPVWGDATDDLNLTLLAWPEGEGVVEHVNSEFDVVVVVVGGAGEIVLDGIHHEIHSGQAIVIQRGTRRGLTAGPDGIRYLSVHRRRGGLQIDRRHGDTPSER
jgi:quercetin dioxygenase-like cupin family protein